MIPVKPSHTLTALEPQRRRGRVSVFIDGEFVIGVGEEVALGLRLKVGQTITPDRLREVAGAEELCKAMDNALRLLDTRPRSQHEIEARLRTKGYEEPIIATVVEKLTRLELIDDTRFAAQWIEAKTRVTGSRPIGRRRLATELFQKGIPKDRITEAVAEVSDDDEFALALAAARKKVRSIPQDRETLRAETQKLLAFLQRRGFGWEVCKKVTTQVLPGIGEELDEIDADE